MAGTIVSPSTFVCVICGEFFTRSDKRERRNIYCSRACYSKRRRVVTEQKCVVCDVIFLQRKRTQRHCSALCSYKALHNVPLESQACKECKNVFLPTRRWNVYCSDTCRNNSKNKWTPQRKAYQCSGRERRNEQQKRRLADISPFKRRLPSFNCRYKASLSDTDLEHMMDNQGGECPLCGVNIRLGADWHIDHIQAVSVGGTSDISNLQLLCVRCNNGKWTMSCEDYVIHCNRVMQKSTKGMRSDTKGRRKICHVEF